MPGKIPVREGSGLWTGPLGRESRRASREDLISYSRVGASEPNDDEAKEKELFERQPTCFDLIRCKACVPILCCICIALIATSQLQLGIETHYRYEWNVRNIAESGDGKTYSLNMWKFVRQASSHHWSTWNIDVAIPPLATVASTFYNVCMYFFSSSTTTAPPFSLRCCCCGLGSSRT